jgi:hypothetical protein
VLLHTSTVTMIRIRTLTTIATPAMIMDIPVMDLPTIPSTCRFQILFHRSANVLAAGS